MMSSLVFNAVINYVMHSLAAYIQSLTYENGFLNYSMDIPKSDSPLWILGVNYSALYG